MDPAEYEGTVRRVNDSLSATLFGGLDQLLGVQGAKFVNMDLSKESDQIHISVFQIKESSLKWKEVSFNSLRLAWDEQAAKLAEYKEDVAMRKKALASKIRAFMALPSAESESGWNPANTATETTALITAFKGEFDFLTTTNRFAESAFLSTYKILRDVPDPSEELSDCLKVCVRAQETLKNAQEQLDIADKVINSNSQHAPMSSAQSLALNDDALAAKYDSRVSEMEQKYIADLSSMREKIDLEMRNREHTLRSMFERNQLELQQQCEESIARKDSELSSVMSSLNALNQRNLEGEERQGMLETEVQKRRELEERLRSTLTELATAQTASHEMQGKFDNLSAKARTIEVQNKKSEKQLLEASTAAQSQVALLIGKMEEAERELLSRPPVDLSALAQSVGMAGGSLSHINFDQRVTDDNSSGDQKRKCLSWDKIECVVVDCIRRASSEATESRVKEQDAMKSLDAVRTECELLQQNLAEKNKVIEALEDDLLAAHNSVSEGNALLKCYNRGNGDKKQSDNDYSDAERLTTLSAEDGWGLSESASKRNSFRVAADCDIEKGSGGKGVAAVVLGESTGGDRMMLAVQGQRDRFMKIAHAKEAEVNSLRVRLERVLEEQKQSSNENLELFRRLRVQRASSRRPADGGHREVDEDIGRSDESAYRSGSHSPSKSRSRRDVKQTFAYPMNDSNDENFKRMDGDALERKYMHLYEEKIDPFQLEELDRQHVLARMNVLERGLAYLTRFFLHDQWARHALMVYLFLVHGFALCYVLQVLNPQLIEEVDSHLKAKWSAETLNIDIIREHPDVRFSRF